jgi:hypothetical protein
MSIWKVLPAAAGVMLMTLVSVQAAPATGASELATAQASESASAVTEVGYRGGYGYGYGYRYGGYGYRGYGYRGYGRGPYIGLGIGAGIVAGAIIANSYYRPRPGYYYDDYEYRGPYYRPAGYAGDPRVLCAENFRSFEWRTGLYTTYGGEKRLCPYLQ